MGGRRPPRERSAPRWTRQPEESAGGPSASLNAASTPTIDPWAEDVLRIWAHEAAESRAEGDKRTRVLWGVGGLALGIFLTGGVVTAFVVVDILHGSLPASDVAQHASPTAGVLAPAPPSHPYASGQTEQATSAPATASPTAEEAGARVTRAEIAAARGRVRTMEQQATTRALRAFLDAKRALARAWIRALGHNGARLKAQAAARSFIATANAAKAAKGVQNPETREAVKLAAYWRDVYDLIVIARAR